MYTSEILFLPENARALITLLGGFIEDLVTWAAFSLGSFFRLQNILRRAKLNAYLVLT